MSINFVRQNRSTYHYAEGHLRYLSDEASRVAKKLHEATSDPATELQLREARSELESLVEELSSVNSAIGNLEALTAAQSRIEIIHTALEKTKSSL